MTGRVYEVGDVWDVSIDVKNSADPPVLVNATSATLTVTGPSGVLYGPTVVSPTGTGHYVHTRTLAADGRHVAVWDTVGPTDRKTFTIDVKPAGSKADPTAQDIANVIPRYTLGDNTSGGAERGTFDDTTRPTGEIAEQIGANWANRVLIALGGSIPVPTSGDQDRFFTAARLVAAIGAAYRIVLSYYPENLELAQQLLADYQAELDGLKLGIEATGVGTPGAIASGQFIPRTAALGFWSVPPPVVEGVG